MGILMNMVMIVVSYLWFGSIVGLVHYNIMRKNYNIVNPWIESNGMTWNKAFGIKFYLWLMCHWYYVFFY